MDVSTISIHNKQSIIWLFGNKNFVFPEFIRERYYQDEMTKFVFPARSCNILSIFPTWYAQLTCLTLGCSILFIKRGVWYFKITAQFTRRGQAKQNILLLVTDGNLPPSILPMISSAFHYYLIYILRIAFSSSPVFLRIILSLITRISKLLAFYVAVDLFLRTQYPCWSISIFSKTICVMIRCLENSA